MTLQFSLDLATAKECFRVRPTQDNADKLMEVVQIALQDGLMAESEVYDIEYKILSKGLLP